MGKLILLALIVFFIWAITHILNKKDKSIKPEYESTNDLIEYFEFQLQKLEKDTELSLEEVTKRKESLTKQLQKLKETKNKLNN